MIHTQNFKFVNVTPPAAIVNNASYVTAEIDTLGYDYANIMVILGATDIAMTALKVQESDVSGSGFADIVGARFGTDADIAGVTSVLPSATDDNKAFVFQLDLRGRKRYLDVVATIGSGATGAFCAIVALLTRGEVSPYTATQMAVGNVLRV